MAAPLLEADRPPFDPAATQATLAAGWALLTEAGAAIADLANDRLDEAPIEPRDFAMRAAAAGPLRLASSERAIDDLAAVLHTGLTAITASAANGRDVTIAAAALWREFVHARASLLAMTEPSLNSSDA